jgi:hypothetical protein
VTVCIAGIHEGRAGASILLVCDRRISIFGGWFSQDGNAKYQPIHKDWICMFAGNVEETNLLIHEVISSLSKLKSSTFSKVVDRCRKAYSTARLRLIETQVLPNFDIATYKEFKQLQKSDEALYLNIQAKIKEAQEDWHLLFAGFDNLGRPHLFVIAGAGTVEYCDSQRVAAIGSGSFAALVWLSFYGYHYHRTLGHSIFGAVTAKFFAERAQDVGQTTVVSLIKSGVNALIHMNDDEVANIRKAWERLPKYSDEAVQEIENRMEQMGNVLRAHLAGHNSPVSVVNALKPNPKG